MSVIIRVSLMSFTTSYLIPRWISPEQVYVVNEGQLWYDDRCKRNDASMWKES